MLDMEINGKYADVMERCLYNSTISGMQLDGKHFFYVNPLESNPGLSGETFGMKHVVPERPGWYSCACCPPNLARMILSIGRLCWSENEDTIYSHLMIGQEAALSLADICIEEADNGATLQALKISRQSEIKEIQENEGILKGTITLTVQGERESVSDELYSFDAPKNTPVTVKAVPYYIWGNRGKGQMRVWIRE